MVQDSNTFLLNANDRLLSIRLSRNWIILGFREVVIPQSKAYFS